MIAKLFNGKSAETVLLFLYAYNEGYANEISKFSGISLNSIQKQLTKFENAGLFVSQFKGKTKMFLWNPRYPFLKEFKLFLKKVFMYLPEKEMEQYNAKRKRPRKSDKKLKEIK